jgi:hypothetical protein
MTKIYTKQRQPNQWTLVLKGLENPNFLINGHVQWVHGHHGCGVFVQMEHHYVPIHHPLFNLTLQYQNFSIVFNISQGCDHVVKGLSLNCEVHIVFCVKVLAYWPSSSSCWCWCSQTTSCKCGPLCVVFLFSRCKKFFLHWFVCFQIIVVLLFLLVFMFSSYNHYLFRIGIVVFKFVAHFLFTLVFVFSNAISFLNVLAFLLV